MRPKSSVVPVYVIQCPTCGEEYQCVGAEVTDVMQVRCRTYVCRCGYRAPFTQWPSELYTNLIVRFDYNGDITAEVEDEL